MKRINSLFLALFLLFVFPLSAHAQESADEPQLIVSTEQAMPGEEVSVTISIENNPGIGVINPKFVFDASCLEWLGYEQGGLRGWTVTSKAGVWLGNEDSDFNGVILTLRFRVLDTAPNGFTEVRLICGKGDAYNYAEEPILFQLVSGGVQIGKETHEHRPAAETRENEISPTCTKPGSYDAVVICSDCGEELRRTTVPVPATGHHYSAPTFQWSDDYSSAFAIFICEQNDDVQKLDASLSRKSISLSSSAAETIELTASVAFQNLLYSETKILSDEGGEISTEQRAEPAPSRDSEPVPAAEAPAPAEGEPSQKLDSAEDASLSEVPAVEKVPGSEKESASPSRKVSLLPILPFVLVLAALAYYLFRRARSSKAK